MALVLLAVQLTRYFLIVVLTPKNKKWICISFKKFNLNEKPKKKKFIIYFVNNVNNILKLIAFNIFINKYNKKTDQKKHLLKK